MKPQFSHALLRLFWFLALLLCSLSFLTNLPLQYFFVELLCGCSIYFAGAHLLILAHLPMFARLRPRRELRLFALLNFVLLLRPGLMALPFMVASAQAGLPSDRPALRLLYASADQGSVDHRGLRALVAAARPDLICISELTANAAQALRLADRYRYRFAVADPGTAGLALYSKFPFLDQPEKDLGLAVPRFLHARIDVGGKPLELALYHAPPPTSASSSRAAWVTLRRISSLLRDSSDAVVVLGNMQATPFGMLYRSVLEWNPWQDAQFGFNLAPTWNAASVWQRATLSHVLINPGVRVRSYDVLEQPGAENLPILVDLQLVNPA